MINASYGLTGKNKATIKALSTADESTERLVKKAEAYFRLLPESIPTFNHFNPALYLLQHPELLDEETGAVEKTLDNFERAFKRIEEFA